MAESRKERWQKQYEPLTPADFELPVTPEKRVRVAAAIATMVRDRNMFGGKGDGPNAETIRGVLVMSEEEWMFDVTELAPIILAYDRVSPRERFTDIARHS